MEQLVKQIQSKSQNYKEIRKDFLKNIPLFSEFSDVSLNKVVDNSKIKEYKKDDVLFMTGDSAEYFRIIIDGWVKLYRETRDGHEVVVSVLTNNDVFGKTAILEKGKYAYSAEAITDVSMLLIPSAFMLHMANEHTSFDHFLAKLLESELNQTSQLQLESEHLAKMTSAERVACFLLKMSGGKDKGSINLQLPYEKALVAGRLGMTPETFSRSLNQLTANGIETKNTIVTINNIEQLCSHVCERCSATKPECLLGEETDET